METSIIMHKGGENPECTGSSKQIFVSHNSREIQKSDSSDATRALMEEICRDFENTGDEILTKEAICEDCNIVKPADNQVIRNKEPFEAESKSSNKVNVQSLSEVKDASKLASPNELTPEQNKSTVSNALLSSNSSDDRILLPESYANDDNIDEERMENLASGSCVMEADVSVPLVINDPFSMKAIHSENASFTDVAMEVPEGDTDSRDVNIPTHGVESVDADKSISCMECEDAFVGVDKELENVESASENNTKIKKSPSSMKKKVFSYTRRSKIPDNIAVGKTLKARRISAKMKAEWVKELESKGRLMCPIAGCYQTYVTMANFQTHYKWCTGQKSLQHCLYCKSLIFSTQKAVLHHMEVEHPDKIDEYKEKYATSDGIDTQNIISDSHEISDDNCEDALKEDRCRKVKNKRASISLNSGQTRKTNIGKVFRNAKAKRNISSKENVAYPKKTILKHKMKSINESVIENIKEFKKCVRFDNIIHKINSVNDVAKTVEVLQSATDVKFFKQRKKQILAESKSEEKTTSEDLQDYAKHSDTISPNRVTTKSRLVLNLECYRRYNEYLKLTRDWACERRTYSRLRVSDMISDSFSSQSTNATPDIQDTHQLLDIPPDQEMLLVSEDDQINSCEMSLSATDNLDTSLCNDYVLLPVKADTLNQGKEGSNLISKYKEYESDKLQTSDVSNTFESLTKVVAAKFNFGAPLPKRVTHKGRTTCYDGASQKISTAIKADTPTKQNHFGSPITYGVKLPVPTAQQSQPVVDFDNLLKSAEAKAKKIGSPLRRQIKERNSMRGSGENVIKCFRSRATNKAKYTKEDGIKLPAELIKLNGKTKKGRIRKIDVAGNQEKHIKFSKTSRLSRNIAKKRAILKVRVNAKFLKNAKMKRIKIRRMKMIIDNHQRMKQHDTSMKVQSESDSIVLEAKSAITSPDRNSNSDIEQMENNCKPADVSSLCVNQSSECENSNLLKAQGEKKKTNLASVKCNTNIMKTNDLVPHSNLNQSGMKDSNIIISEKVTEDAKTRAEISENENNVEELATEHRTAFNTYLQITTNSCLKMPPKELRVSTADISTESADNVLNAACIGESGYSTVHVKQNSEKGNSLTSTNAAVLLTHTSEKEVKYKHESSITASSHNGKSKNSIENNSKEMNIEVLPEHTKYIQENTNTQCCNIKQKRGRGRPRRKLKVMVQNDQRHKNKSDLSTRRIAESNPKMNQKINERMMEVINNKIMADAICKKMSANVRRSERVRKRKLPKGFQQDETETEKVEDITPHILIKKKRGRPKKNSVNTSDTNIKNNHNAISNSNLLRNTDASARNMNRKISRKGRPRKSVQFIHGKASDVHSDSLNGDNHETIMDAAVGSKKPKQMSKNYHVANEQIETKISKDADRIQNYDGQDNICHQCNCENDDKFLLPLKKRKQVQDPIDNSLESHSILCSCDKKTETDVLNGDERFSIKEVNEKSDDDVVVLESSMKITKSSKFQRKNRSARSTVKKFLTKMQSIANSHQDDNSSDLGDSDKDPDYVCTEDEKGIDNNDSQKPKKKKISRKKKAPWFRRWDDMPRMIDDGDFRVMHPTLNFYSKYSCENLLPNFKPKQFMWKPLGGSLYSEFLPPLKNSAMIKVFNMGPGKETDWFSLKCFDSAPVDDESRHFTFFTGGPVWSSAWCPVPMNEQTAQYIALATSTSLNSCHTYLTTNSEKGLIQLWDIGNLNDYVLKQKPMLKLGLSHNHGIIWDMAWCPNGCWESSTVECSSDDLPRLGLLAVACSDSYVRIYSIPHPGILKSHTTGVPLYCSWPVVVLCPLYAVSNIFAQKSMCLSISWQRTDGCEHIAAGYGNGMICVWQITSQATVLVKDNEVQKTILPYLIFQAHGAAVTSLSFAPLPGNRWLLSTGIDKNIKFWDLLDTSLPFCTAKRGSTKSVHWAPYWGKGFAVVDDGTISGISSTFKGNSSSGTQALSPHSAFVLKSSVSEWMNMQAVSDIGGNITLSVFQDLLGEDCKINYPEQFIFFTTQLKKILTKEVKSNKEAELHEISKADEEISHTISDIRDVIDVVNEITDVVGQNLMNESSNYGKCGEIACNSINSAHHQIKFHSKTYQNKKVISDSVSNTVKCCHCQTNSAIFDIVAEPEKYAACQYCIETDTRKLISDLILKIENTDTIELSVPTELSSSLRYTTSSCTSDALKNEVSLEVDRVAAIASFNAAKFEKSEISEDKSPKEVKQSYDFHSITSDNDMEAHANQVKQNTRFCSKPLNKKYQKRCQTESISTPTELTVIENDINDSTHPHKSHLNFISRTPRISLNTWDQAAKIQNNSDSSATKPSSRSQKEVNGGHNLKGNYSDLHALVNHDISPVLPNISSVTTDEASSDLYTSTESSVNSELLSKDIGTKYAYYASYENVITKYGVVFKDALTEDTKGISDISEHEEMDVTKLPLEQYPLSSINTIAWNPNYRSHFWLFSAGQSGIARLSSINQRNLQTKATNTDLL